MLSRTISFTSFNLYNLNAPGLPIYTNSEGLTDAEVDRKVAWSGAMLRRARADVFGFQELWHTPTLARVIDAAGMEQEYEMLAPATHLGQRIICAGAVRRDMLEGTPEWISDFPPGFILQSSGGDPQTAAISVRVTQFSRPVLHFKVRPRRDQPAIHVYVCHFKSKGPTPVFREGWYRAETDLYRPHATAIGAAISTIRRTAEALALRQILTDVMKTSDTPVIVLGDLNDDHNSNTLNIISEQPRYLEPTSSGGADNGLYSGQALQQMRSQRDVYYTHIWQDIHGSLDHILASEQFYDMSRKRIWKFDGLDIYNDHLNRPEHRDDEGTNDHGIVRARFSYKRAP